MTTPTQPTATHERKPSKALAFQYRKQPKTEWPKWLLDYTVTTQMGIQPIGAGPGVLLVPTKHGVTLNVLDTEWVVLENVTFDPETAKIKTSTLSVYKNDAFEDSFAPVVTTSEVAPAPVEVVVAEAPAAPVEAVPAAETTAAPAKGRATRATAEAPAEAPAPAAEEPAADA